jgi:hypothetical protein
MHKTFAALFAISACATPAGTDDSIASLCTGDPILQRRLDP